MAWELTYESYRPEQERLRESLCVLGNGYFATRGATPDSAADDTHYPGTYIAGLYDRLTSTIDGREIENEDLVNAPNWLPLTFRIGDGPWFALDAVQILDFSQRLDLRNGVLIRALRFCDERGRITRWQERRLVSMAERHRAGLEVELVAENWTGPITIRTQLDASVVNDGVARYRGLENRHLRTLDARALAPGRMFLRAETLQSRVEIALAAELRLSRAGNPVDSSFETHVCHDLVEQRARTTLDRSPLRIEKLIALYTSRDPAISEAGLAARQCIERSDDFDGLLARHRQAWHQLWERCDLAFQSRSDNGEPMKLRLHVFHLLQTVSPNTMDFDVGVPARGWHGEAYRGHVFWDELFILPFLTLRMPELVRDTIRYRYRRLEAARLAARECGFRGAMFPWQSGSDGREESQRLHLNPHSGRWLPDNTHRQRHVNAAICYNVWHYWEATRDDEFLFSHGAELFLSIAQFWASAVRHDPRSDRYEIKGVMGPDEFHTAYPGVPPENESGIDNNAYTNILVAWLLSRARDIIDLLPRVLSRALLDRLDIDLEELERWYEISRKLKVPFHADGIISQFEGYEHLEELDWRRYRAQYGNIQRLDRILEAEGDSANRYKVSKQADVLMLFYLFSAEELAMLFEDLGYAFDRDCIPRNIRYYAERTSHGSTLSLITHAWVLARADRAHSWHLFQRALDSDVADIQGGTTAEGIHGAAMAGTVDLVQRNYLGLETRADVLHFNPLLPTEVERLSARLQYREHRLDVEATRTHLRIYSHPAVAAMITIAYRSHHRKLNPGDRHEFRMSRPRRPGSDQQARKNA
jgi:alpha,alpha-trehalase